MFTQNLVTNKLAKVLELQEAAYWGDYFFDVPDELSGRLGIREVRIGSARGVITRKMDILAFNRVIGLGMDKPATEAEVDDIISAYIAAGVSRFFIQLSPCAQPQNLPEMLLAKGFHHHNNWVKFYRDIHPLPKVDCSLTVQQIGADKADIFGRMIVTAFEWPEALAPMIALPVGKPGWKHYLVYDGNHVAACGALYIRGEYATLAFAATLPEYRGRGAQAALIARRFDDAARAGCRFMLTETAEETPERSVPSYRNMRRHGFEVAYLRPNYIYLNER